MAKSSELIKLQESLKIQEVRGVEFAGDINSLDDIRKFLKDNNVKFIEKGVKGNNNPWSWDCERIEFGDLKIGYFSQRHSKGTLVISSDYPSRQFYGAIMHPVKMILSGKKLKAYSAHNEEIYGIIDAKR